MYCQRSEFQYHAKNPSKQPVDYKSEFIYIFISQYDKILTGENENSRNYKRTFESANTLMHKCNKLANTTLSSQIS